MSAIDWGVVALYLAGMVTLGLYLARKTASAEDYFLGGRRIPPWLAALSVMATQTSTISLISAPAFVAIKPGGGLRWLQGELAVPLAMIAISAVMVPRFWRSRVTTVFEFLELRFGLPSRLLLSSIFQLSRAAASGVTIYATSLVVAAATGAPIWALILAIGVVCIAYSTLGGIVADIYTDAVQLFVLAGAVLIATGFALHGAGGIAGVGEGIDASRTAVLQLRQTGLGDGADYALWPMLIGGFFLYWSYYGTDQTQVQRVLSASSVEAAQRTLFLNGLLRFVLVACYCVFGLALAGYLARHPQLRAAIPEDKLDMLVPLFLVRELPSGIVGVAFAGMLAATMSSLDSTYNSLSAATVTDILERFRLVDLQDPRRKLRVARFTALGWGVVSMVFSFFAGGIAQTVIEAVNKLGSLFYGPVLATFALGLLTRWVSGWAMVAGIVAGVGLNLTLWRSYPSISWLWWNPFGAIATAAVAAVASTLLPRGTVMIPGGEEATPGSRGRAWVLLLYSGAILAASLLLGQIFGPAGESR